MDDESAGTEVVAPLAGALRGEVSYRERMMPRPGSKLLVTLEDVSRADAPAEVLSTDTIAVNGGPPWRFLLGFEPSDADRSRRYAVRARLEGPDGSLMFMSTESIPAFDETREGPIQIMMQRVGGASAPR